MVTAASVAEKSRSLTERAVIKNSIYYIQRHIIGIISGTLAVWREHDIFLTEITERFRSFNFVSLHR